MLKSFHSIHYLIFAFVFGVNYGYSQVKSIGLPDIRNYKRTDYKASAQNWDMDQDINGNLYFANNNGLLEFDGTSWYKYNMPQSKEVRSLKIHDNGRIYVGGYNAFGYFKANAKGKLEYHPISNMLSQAELKVIDMIWKIHIMNDEVIFQSFTNAYILKNNKLTKIKAPNKFQFSFCIDNKLYIQEQTKGILEYSKGKLIPLKNTSELNNTEVWGLQKLSANKLFIATIDKGLFIYEDEKLKPWDTEANNFIKKNNSLGATVINDSLIVINSVLDGLIICNFKGKIIQHINRNKGLQNNTVLTSFIDQKNNIWLGLDNGISYVNENSPYTYFGNSYNLSTVYSTIIYKDYLYIATNQGVFYHHWKSPIKDSPFTLLPGTTGQAWRLQIIDGQIFCAHNRGAIIINEDKTIKLLDKNGYWSFKMIPNNPNLMIASNYNGFSIFEKTKNGWAFKNYLKGFDKSINPFQIDANFVWFKKDDLVYQMKITDDFKNIELINTYQGISDKIKKISSIQYLNNSVYFLAENFFFKYSNEMGNFVEGKNLSHLFKNKPIIKSTHQDSEGNIWYFYNESLGAYIKNKNGTYKNIEAPFTNLTGNLVYYYESADAFKNDIFIGLTDGLAHYDSKLLKNQLIKPKAFIRSFTYPGDTLILNKGRDSIKNVSLSFSDNHVKFTFSTPTYENIENIEYSYQLENFDNEWSNWSTISIKEYTNLHEGSYKMKLKVRNSFGIVSNTTSFNFSIAAPWYRNYFAYFMYILLLLTAIYFIRRQTKVKIRKNKYFETIEQRRIYLEKETRIKQEQYELEKEIERLENEKLQTKLLSKDKELVNNTLQVVKKNKILNGILHKIKDIDTNDLNESTKFQFTKLNKSIAKEVGTDKSWKDLEKHIKNVHFDFLKRLKEKHPNISPRELDLSTYLLMNMSTKEIAEIMNISTGGVELARYRLRKKLTLIKKENLIGYLLKI